jgi:F-type H+-transporting ATPase subunit delta
MNDSKISVRYSRALFQSAVEKTILEKVFEDMNYISELCRMDEIKEVLLSPIIVPSKKKTIFLALLGKNVEKLTISLVNLLITNGRESYLPAVARVFRHETLKYRGITETNLVTAVPVNEKIRKQITDLVSVVFDTKVELKETVDESIIGGFILKVNDNFIDASVKSKLRTIRKGLSVRVGEKEK